MECSLASTSKWLAALWLATAVGEGAMAAATFVVDSTDDAVDASAGDGACATATGACTLRAAIQEANALAGADDIQVPAGTFKLRIAGQNEDAAATGDLDLTSDLTITGAGRNLTFVDGTPSDGGALDRVFDVGPTAVGTMTISQLTVQRGGVAANGGCVRALRPLTLVDARLRWCAATGSGKGGGLYLGHPYSAVAPANITRVDVEDNSGTFGGGIYAELGLAEITDTNVGWNSSGNAGGGISLAGSALTNLTRVTVNHNVASGAAGYGGGINASGGTLRIRNSTLHGNTAAVSGGGLNNTGVAYLYNVTVSRNRANTSSGVGGGVRSSSPYLFIANSILSDNAAAGSHDCDTFESLDHNLIENTSGCFPAGVTTNHVTGVDPLLGPLAYYGSGLTRTQPLLPGSAAIDEGNPAAPGSGGSACEAADQQGTARSGLLAPCDIGAWEADGSEAVPLPPDGADFIVTSFFDPPGFPGSTEASLGNGFCANTAGDCTLRAAIEESNALAGAQVIFLPRGHYEDGQTVSGDDAARWGDLDVTSGSTITLLGEEPEETVVSARTTETVFHVLSGGVLHLETLTVRRGAANLGGGVLNGGTLTVTDAILRDNFGNVGSGVYSTGPLTVTNSTIRDNRAAFNGGGGIATSTASAVVIDSSELVENVAASLGRGGALLVSGAGAVTITSSTLAGNRAKDGGGVAVNSSYGAPAVTISSSTIRGNVADYTATDGRGGGIWTTRLVALTNSTVSGNTAVLDGGGFFAGDDYDMLTSTNVTFADNAISAPGFHYGIQLSLPFGEGTFANTVVRGAVSPLCGDGSFGALVSLGHNLSQDASCNFVDADDLENTDPLLGPLADNGGPTWTHALLPGSPAIDAGDDAAAPATDQRGTARPQGPQSDIGAYEVLEVALEADLSVIKDNGAATVVPGTTTTWEIEVANAGPEDVTGALVVDDFDGVLLDVSSIAWTCASSPGAGAGTTCPAAGSGAELEAGVAVDLEAGDSVVFVVEADVLPGATGTLDNTVTVSADGIDDPESENDTSTDSDTLAPEADLGIGKSNGVDTVSAGGETTYTVVASNAGPSAVVAAAVGDLLPTELACSWTCTPAEGASCTAGPMAGDLADLVDLAPGASATYTAVCDVDTEATGTLDNTATIAPPAGTTDPNPANDGATDSDTVEAAGPPEELALHDQTIDDEGTVTVTALRTVTLGPSLAVLAPAELVVVAGESVRIVPVFRVELGATFTIRIDPSLVPP